LISHLTAKIQESIRLGRALRLVWQSGPRWAIASGILLFIQGILPLLSLYLMKLVIDAVTDGISAANGDKVWGQVLWLIGISAIVTLLGNLSEVLKELVSEAQSQAVSDCVSALIHSKSITIDLEYYENPQYYDALHRAQQEAAYRPTSVLNGLLELGLNGISSLALAALIVSLNWLLAVALTLAALPGVLVRLRYDRRLYQWRRQKTHLERQAYYFDWLLVGGEFAKELRLFNLGHPFAQRFQALRRQLHREKLKIAANYSLTQLVTQFSTTLATFGCYAFIAYQAVRGTITLGDLVMYQQAFSRLQGALKGILGSLARLYADNLFLTNLYEFLDLKPKIAEPAHPHAVPRPIQQGIAFNNASFQYPGSSRQAIENASLQIRPGEVVALVGENGSGKTTLIKLLCRLYDPTAGSITLDGIDLRQFSTTDLRRQISVIFQDYVKYNLTARENIWVGNAESHPDSPEIEEAARWAGADAVIDRLPDSYDTVLGNLFEGGEELSIGQWQKLAMARAFLRDSQILILDEPTSAMDPKAEAEVFARFRQLIGERSAIIISHRLSTVKLADCVYVLERGKIVESGSHDELMAQGGLYATLFNTQARYYDR
jgi:ATP-binding cassette subfamily B protein